jgi:adenylate kinase
MLEHQGIKLDAVLSYELPMDEIVDRLCGRRLCSKCKHVYHVTARPPHVEGICDLCGGELMQRDDDHPAPIRVRLVAYEESTRPLVDYYRKSGRLLTIVASGTPEEILERTIESLQARVGCESLA